MTNTIKEEPPTRKQAVLDSTGPSNSHNADVTKSSNQLDARLGNLENLLASTSQKLFHPMPAKFTSFTSLTSTSQKPGPTSQPSKLFNSNLDVKPFQPPTTFKPFTFSPVLGKAPTSHGLFDSSSSHFTSSASTFSSSTASNQDNPTRQTVPCPARSSNTFLSLNTTSVTAPVVEKDAIKHPKTYLALSPLESCSSGPTTLQPTPMASTSTVTPTTTTVAPTPATTTLPPTPTPTMTTPIACVHLSTKPEGISTSPQSSSVASALSTCEDEKGRQACKEDTPVSSQVLLRALQSTLSQPSDHLPIEKDPQDQKSDASVPSQIHISTVSFPSSTSPQSSSVASALSTCKDEKGPQAHKEDTPVSSQVLLWALQSTLSRPSDHLPKTSRPTDSATNQLPIDVVSSSSSAVVRSPLPTVSNSKPESVEDPHIQNRDTLASSRNLCQNIISTLSYSSVAHVVKPSNILIENATKISAAVSGLTPSTSDHQSHPEEQTTHPLEIDALSTASNKSTSDTASNESTSNSEDDVKSSPRRLTAHPQAAEATSTLALVTTTHQDLAAQKAEPVVDYDYPVQNSSTESQDPTATNIHEGLTDLKKF
ncbi:hypothetical protein PGTUg99_006988 [Puccinia graminis f. sp. tritici]|uniref:Uncharacterized protein n=1 Tax=Puccinia graminis f. sp. tritici TaxID=56615 RepID=A0A5B0RG81_PUCGR|nr:hypothetical protein PGTUg99_006988 [Puccinia graminis f. sp. tritici]